MTAHEAALAWAHGKKVESAEPHLENWLPVDAVGECENDQRSPSIFCFSSHWRSRLAPEPVMRPLTIEEWKGRVGSVVKLKAAGDVVVVAGVDAEYVMPALFAGYTPSEMLERWTFADGSPCGVMDGGVA
jgi:hypothetical protein